MGIFFRLQIDERIGISLVEVYKRVGKFVICGLLKGLKGVTDEFYWFIKPRKRSTFITNPYLKDSAIYSSQKGCKVLNKVCDERRTICQ